MLFKYVNEKYQLMILGKIVRKFVSAIAVPSHLTFFFEQDVGRDYGLNFLDKVMIVRRFRKNLKRIPSASNWREHLCIASEILKIPPTIKGDVVECGCYKGGSSANLSLICNIVGRKLVLCDSFEGLPVPQESDRVHYNIFIRRRRIYRKGDFAGALDEVKDNITQHGKIEACEFVKGYYKDTLKHLDGSYVLIFADVDLHESLRECLIFLWPRLINNSYFFSHEAQDPAYIALFFDRRWWHKNLNCEPPGFIGAGSGLPLTENGSGLGYAIKFDVNSDTKNWQRVAFSEG